VPFPAETVQLFYQIAVTGFRDIGVVPEPRVAFEMTLLRMLAFAPDDHHARHTPALAQAGADVAVTQRATSGAEPAPGRAGPVAVAPGPGAPGSGAVAPVSCTAAPGTDDWYALVERLDLAGIARSLAEHCVVAAAQGDAWTLQLDGAHDTLLNDGSRAAIERALGKALARQVSLTITSGVPATETPAARRQRVQHENQARAESAFQADPTVRQLLTEFDGRLESVRPVAADSGGGHR
jgi:DNA polymerase-3 subunit gamma/tau